MLTPYRLYIASPDADAIERSLTHEPRLLTIGSGSGGEVLRELYALTPDLLILDNVLMGADGPSILKKAGDTMPAPPRTLFLRRTAAADAPADAACPYPCDGETLLYHSLMAAEKPVSVLAAPWMEERRKIGGTLLERLGVPRRLKGWEYLREAAAWWAACPGFPEGKRTYSLLARQFGSSLPAVEKAIRTAVEQTWLQGNLAEIQALFGLSVDAEKGKPTNLECIAMLGEHIRRQLRHKMAT